MYCCPCGMYPMACIDLKRFPLPVWISVLDVWQNMVSQLKAAEPPSLGLLCYSWNNKYYIFGSVKEPSFYSRNVSSNSAVVKELEIIVFPIIIGKNCPYFSLNATTSCPCIQTHAQKNTPFKHFSPHLLYKYTDTCIMKKGCRVLWLYFSVLSVAAAVM